MDDAIGQNADQARTALEQALGGPVILAAFLDPEHGPTALQFTHRATDLLDIGRDLLAGAVALTHPEPLTPEHATAVSLALRLLPAPQSAADDSEDRPPAPLFHLHWRPIAGGTAEHTAGAFHLGSALDLVRALTRGSDGNTVYWFEPVAAEGGTTP